MRQNKLKTQDVVVMYTEKHLTLRQIGKLVGMSASAVSKRLRSAGVLAADGTIIKANCAFCGAEVERYRAKARNNVEIFCNPNCYAAKRESPGYKPWRQGQRLARAIVAQWFDLQPEHVVDHKDGDNRNNNLDNLRVYANQSDHIKMHHRKATVVPVWDGAHGGMA